MRSNTRSRASRSIAPSRTASRSARLWRGWRRSPLRRCRRMSAAAWTNGRPPSSGSWCGDASAGCNGHSRAGRCSGGRSPAWREPSSSGSGLPRCCWSPTGWMKWSAPCWPPVSCRRTPRARRCAQSQHHGVRRRRHRFRACRAEPLRLRPSASVRRPERRRLAHHPGERAAAARCRSGRRRDHHQPGHPGAGRRAARTSSAHQGLEQAFRRCDRADPHPGSVPRSGPR